MNPETYNDSNVCQFIDRRFQEQFRTEEERWTFLSFIDYYLKWCSSKADGTKIVDEIFRICRKNGYVPQYNVSGWATFFTERTYLSKDSKFLISPNPTFTLLAFSGEMRPYAAFFSHRAERVDLSPGGDRLVNFYRDGENNRSIEVWDTREFSIILESDTTVSRVWWTGPESFYYTNGEGNLMKMEGPSTHIDTGINLDEDVFAFAVDEDTKQILSLGQITCVTDIGDGRCWAIDTEMSRDAEICLSKEGFRVFSNGVLYGIEEYAKVLFESDRSCISRESIDGYNSIHIRGFGKDCRGIFAYTDGIRYYLGENGVKSVASYHCWSELPPAASDLIEKNIMTNPFILEDSTVEDRRRYVKDELLSMRTVAITDGGYGRTHIIRPLGMASPFVHKVEVFSFSNPRFFSMSQGTGNGFSICQISDIHILDAKLVDDSALESKDDMENKMVLGELGLELYGATIEMDDYEPITKVLVTALPDDAGRYKASIKADRFSICISPEYRNDYITFIINDAGKIRCVDGRLTDLTYGQTVCEKPIIHGNGVWFCVEADGCCKRLECVNAEANLVLCTGNTVLWRSGQAWYKGHQPLSNLEINGSDRLALVSEDSILTSRFSGRLDQILLESNECRIINLYESCYWNVLGLSDSGYLSMVHFIREDSEVTVDFAELNMKTGAWKELNGGLRFPVSMSEGLGYDAEHMWGSIFNYIDLRRQRIIQIGSDINSPRIRRFDLSNGKVVPSRNGLRANYTKNWVSPVELNDGLYLIATTEPDDDDTEKGGDAGDKQASRGIKGHIRPELRIMNSRTGLRFRNGDRFGGIMYGPKGYYLRERVRPIRTSPDRRFVFATYDSPEVAINSFDVLTQKTYPDVPVRGIILGFPAEGCVLVGLLNDDGSITSSQVFDYRLNPVGQKSSIFRVRDMYDDLEYEIPDAADASGKYWCSTHYINRLRDQGNLFNMAESEVGKTDIEIGLNYVLHGAAKNSIMWNTTIVPDYDRHHISEILECLRKNVKFASTSCLTAIFDMSKISMKDRDGDYEVTIVRGDKKAEVKIQSPFYVGGSYYPRSCPVSVLADTFARSFTYDGNTRIERCRITEDGEIIVLNTLDIRDECHYVPVFADEDLLIVRREDEELFFTEGWKDLHRLELAKNSNCFLYGNTFLAEKKDGTYRFVNEDGDSVFFDGRLRSARDTNRYPSELKMSTGTLEWKGGIFTVRL